MHHVAILVGANGRGSNMASLVRAISEWPDVEVSAVIAPKSTSPAIEVAQSLGCEVRIASTDAELETALYDAEFVCLAGFMRLFPPLLLHRFEGRILNVHPALLPKFGGKGMYGLHVHRAVIESGETESGCTVHHVTEHYDEGAPILQLRCAVLPDDEPETLAARVLKLEHAAYPIALRKVIDAHV